MLLKISKEFKVKKLIVKKRKLNIKCLNININKTGDFSTYYLLSFFSVSSTIAKFATIAIV